MSYQCFTSPGQLTAADTRHFSTTSAGTVTADSDFPGGYAKAISAVGSVLGMPIFLADQPNLASGDELNVVFGFKLAGAWSPGATMTVAELRDTRLPGTPGCGVQMYVDNADQAGLIIYGGGGSTDSSPSLWTLTESQYYLMRLRFKRTGASACEAELYQYSGGSWVSKVTVSRASWTANPIKAFDVGIGGTFGKGGSGTVRAWHSIVAYNETPSPTAMAYWLLPNADGGTLEWTLSTGTTHYAVLDDAFGSIGADYAESGTAASDKREDIGFENFPASTASAFYGVAIGRQDDVATAGTGRHNITVREGGADGTFIDTYAWDAAATNNLIFFEQQVGGGDWDETAVNACEAVLKRLAASATNWRVNALALGVLYEPVTAKGIPYQRRASMRHSLVR